MTISTDVAAVSTSLAALDAAQKLLANASDSLKRAAHENERSAAAGEKAASQLAAGNAALEEAGAIAGQVRGDRDAVVARAAEVSAARDQILPAVELVGAVAPAAAQVAIDRAAVDAAAIDVEAKRAEAVAAAEMAQTAAAQRNIDFDTLALATTAIADFDEGAGVNVNSDGANNGYYVKQSGAWVRKSTATLPGLDADLSPIRGALASEPVAPTDKALVRLTNKLGAVFGEIFRNGFATRNFKFNPPGADGWMRIVDGNGFVAFAISPTGKVHFRRMETIEKRVAALEDVASPPVPAVTPIHGPALYTVSGERFPLYVRNILPERHDSEEAMVTLASNGTSPAAPFVRSSGEEILVEADALGSTADLIVRQSGSGERLIVPLTVARNAVPVAGSPAPKILLLGDSITNRQTGQFIKDRLSAWGYNPTFIGTINGANHATSTTDATGPLGEGREGWAFADYIYSAIDSDVTSVVEPGGEAAYLALSKASKRLAQPFIRAATGGDDPALVFNGYVFDFAFYLARFGLASPDIVLINLGMNDIIEAAPSAALARVAQGLPIMLNSMRAALPAAKIGVWFTALPRASDGDVQWTDEHLPILRKIIEIVRARQASDANLHLISTWAHQSQEAGWALNSGAADAATGVATTTISDIIHPTGVARAQQADRLAAYIANMA